MQHIVFLPRLDETDDSSQLLGLLKSEIPELQAVTLGSIGEELDERAWIAAVCLGISKQTYERDVLHFVAFDSAVNRLPDIAFANRAAHRTIHSYTFVDCVPESFLPEWPDAPVTLIMTNPLSTLGQSAKLRGWDVLMIDRADLPVTLAKTLQNFTI
jgi:hypothetical protein